MKKVLIPALALTLLVGASPAFADTNGTTTIKDIRTEKREALKDAQDKLKQAIDAKKQEIQTERDNLKKDVQDQRGEMRDMRLGFRQEAATHVIAMLDAMAGRFQTLIDRTSSRVAKVNGTGATTTDATAALNQAKADLAQARAQIDAVKAINLDFGTTTSTTTVKAAADQFKASVKAVKDTFNAIHKDLEKALSSLPHVKAEGTATTTATSTSAH